MDKNYEFWTISLVILVACMGITFTLLNTQYSASNNNLIGNAMTSIINGKKDPYSYENIVAIDPINYDVQTDNSNYLFDNIFRDSIIFQGYIIENKQTQELINLIVGLVNGDLKAHKTSDNQKFIFEGHLDVYGEEYTSTLILVLNEIDVIDDKYIEYSEAENYLLNKMLI